MTHGLLGGIEARTRLMDRMMDRTGATDILFDRPDAPSQYRAITQRCLTCTHGSECALWLDASDRPSDAPAFCRNSKTFAAVTAS